MLILMLRSVDSWMKSNEPLPLDTVTACGAADANHCALFGTGVADALYTGVCFYLDDLDIHLHLLCGRCDVR